MQAILWKEPRILPDFPREHGEYWSPAREWDTDMLWAARVLASLVRVHRNAIPTRQSDRLSGLSEMQACQANRGLWR